MTKPQLSHTLFVFLGFVVLLSVAYWPAISSSYVVHDDTVFFLKAETRLDPPGTFALMSRGRYVGAVLFALFGQIVHSIDDLKIIRFLGVIQLSVCGLLLTLWMQRYFSYLLAAFLIVLLLLTLPPFQVLVANTGMCFLPFSILFAILSFRLADSMLLDKPFLKKFFSLRMFFAAVLFVVALSTYQPGAMFYWSLFGFWVLFAKPQPFKESLVKAGVLFFPAFLGFGIYAGILQVTKKYFAQFNLFSYNPYVFSTDYMAKLRWFFAEPVVNILNLWNIFPSVLYAFFVLFFIVIGSAVAYGRRAKNKEIVGAEEMILRACLLVALLFLSSLPNLVTTSDMSLYRCYMALAALVVFLFFWASWQMISVLPYKKFFGVTLALLSLLGVAQAYQTVLQYRVVPSRQETAFFVDAVRQKNLNDYQRVYVVLSDEKLFRNRGDEYGNLTTFYSHDIIGMFTCAIKELSKNALTVYMMFVYDRTNQVTYVFRELRDKSRKYAYRVIVESGLQRKTEADFGEPTLIIDMTQFHLRPESLYRKSVKENPLKL